MVDRFVKVFEFDYVYYYNKMSVSLTANSCPHLTDSFDPYKERDYSATKSKGPCLCKMTLFSVFLTFGLIDPELDSEVHL